MVIISAGIKEFFQVECSDGKRFVKRLTVPIDFNLITTKKCNADCVHCCASANESDEVLSKENIRKIVKVAEQNKIFYFVVTGGEPLMYEHFWSLLDTLNNKFGIIINTNGTLIDDSIAENLKKYTIASIHVSLDAPNEKIYSKQRGSTTKLQDVLNGIKVLVKNGLPVTTKLVVTDLNKNCLEEVVKLSISLGVKKMTFSWFKSIGRGKKNEINLNLKGDDKRNLAKKLYELKSKYKDLIKISFDESQCFPFLLETSNSRFYKKICGGFFCRIDYKGDLYPCPFLDTKIGNLFDTDLTALWKSDYLKNLRHISWGNNLSGVCEHCEKKQLCIGGCRARTLSEFGNLTHKDPLCWVK